MRPVILLTTTVYVLPSQKSGQWDPDVRVRVYHEIIQKWLDETKLHIVVVENSGYKFPNLPKDPRLEIITYSRENIPPDRRNFLENCKDKGNHELFAIDYALNNSVKLRNCEFFIKVTGRYFVPLLDTMEYEPALQAIAQHDPSRCEVLGCRRDMADRLFSFPSRDPHIEQTYERRINTFKHARRLPLIHIPRTEMGSGVCVDTL